MYYLCSLIYILLRKPLNTKRIEYHGIRRKSIIITDMSNVNLTPDYLFEVSWEVCN